eukprot:CAMPEP_0174982048 /NCGR_PEP_ID=MMETSP0004_2-20121128/16250_1 /TAXON_ID=420556 /ORGANISM="Ochromonas sp., Strain CCMP1393" /LENGTH=1017 /DNA_ID=CAMNT_0016233903 /DNA_START=17 /DNA_END=3070 /DNA_ORIENTATION=-
MKVSITTSVMLASTMLFLFMSTCLAEHEEEENGVDPSVVILFMFFGLGIGVLIMQGLSLVGDPIPYTCVVFLLGILFSVCNKNNGGLLGKSISQWADIDAELLLFTFLPPLIFGEAMSLNFYHVEGGLMQAVILAGPGVLMGAVIMGTIAKFMLPYDWSWTLAMTFGSILSATDPVAVVALLKSAGASPKLTILIVGESLLNDGTAMVLFEIFYNSLNGTRYTVPSITGFFLAAAFGSVLLGLACGLICVRWMRTANRPLKEIDTTIQIAITVCCAYLVFFSAQFVLEISGVLACCGAGIMLAWLAPPVILSHETMHNVWGMIEWALNTLIFMLAGLIIGHRVIEHVRAVDWIYVVVLYALLMVARFFIIAFFYPVLSTIGHKCTKAEAVFMAWAGLRGALGMTLALLVERNCPDHLEDETSRLFFYVGGIAALTLIINAPTANQLLVVLGLLGADSAEKTLVMNQIKKRLRRRMDRVLEDMAVEFAFTTQDLDEVRASCSLLSGANMDSLYRDSERMSLAAATVGGGGGGGAAGGGASSGQVSPVHPFMNKKALSNVVAGGDRGDSSRRSLSPAPVDISANNNANNTRTNPMRVASSASAAQEEEEVEEAVDEDFVAETPAASLFGDRSDDNAATKVLRRHTANNEAAGGGDARRNSVEDRRRSFRNSQGSRSASTNDVLAGTAGADGATSNASGNRQRSGSILKGEELVRALSMTNRGSHPMLTKELLAYVRAIFLEIVRVRYWHDIERGKLPRLSHSANFLLYCVEVAVDEVDQEEGNRDWKHLHSGITKPSFLVRLLTYIESWNIWSSATYYLGMMEARREKRAVYMLTSFIEAHEHAQAKIHEFVVEDDDEVHIKSPEELKVIAESQQAVEMARNMLDAMSPETVTQIRAKQAAALVLNKQAEMVKHMVSEGVLSSNHAESILEEVSEDLSRLENSQNTMYWKHGEAHGKRRRALRIEEMETGGGPRRSSLFSLFDSPTKSAQYSYYSEDDDVKKAGKGTNSSSQPLMHSND